MDRREAGVGLLSGSHLAILSTIDSGASGKGGQEVDTEPFLRKIVGVLRNSWREGDLDRDRRTRAHEDGPRNRVAADPDLRKRYVLVEGFDLSGADGVRGLLKFEGFKSVASDSLLVKVQQIVEEVIKR